MAQAIIYLVIGLACVTLGAEALVRTASRLAVAFGFSPLFVGLTLVAYGTSSPELIVSLNAALRGFSDLSVGNIVGSNIFNIGAVLGISALIAPTPCNEAAVRRQVPVVILVTVVLLLVSLGGVLTRLEGAALVVILVAYTVWSYRTSRARPNPGHESHDPGTHSARSILGLLLLSAGGIGLLLVGARWVVDSAVTMAELLQVTDVVIGATLVAVGTSLPELATSSVAALRREPEIAIGNVLGSNIFNVLGILGAAALARPLSIVPLVPAIHIPIALGFAVACLPMMMTGRRISRLEGLVLTLAYGSYCVLVL